MTAFQKQREKMFFFIKKISFTVRWFASPEQLRAGLSVLVRSSCVSWSPEAKSLCTARGSFIFKREGNGNEKNCGERNGTAASYAGIHDSFYINRASCCDFNNRDLGFSSSSGTDAGKRNCTMHPVCIAVFPYGKSGHSLFK